MLRMGKNQKQEPTDNEKMALPQAQHHHQQQQPQQPAYNAPAQPAAPPQYTYQEPPARPEVEQPNRPRAVLESESLAREIKEGTMSGFVGSGTTLSGEAVFKGMLRVDGHLTGQIRSEEGTLIVSSGGRVDADIAVAVAKINGTINGDIVVGERLELGRTAQVRGDIQTPVLVIEQGAVFEGSCRMGSAMAAQEERPVEKPRAREAAAGNALPQPAREKSSASAGD